jgi:hypothetical protein
MGEGIPRERFLDPVLRMVCQLAPLFRQLVCSYAIECSRFATEVFPLWLSGHLSFRFQHSCYLLHGPSEEDAAETH